MHAFAQTFHSNVGSAETLGYERHPWGSPQQCYSHSVGQVSNSPLSTRKEWISEWWWSVHRVEGWSVMKARKPDTGECRECRPAIRAYTKLRVHKANVWCSQYGHPWGRLAGWVWGQQWYTCWSQQSLNGCAVKNSNKVSIWNLYIFCEHNLNFNKTVVAVFEAGFHIDQNSQTWNSEELRLILNSWFSCLSFSPPKS